MREFDKITYEGTYSDGTAFKMWAYRTTYAVDHSIWFFYTAEQKATKDGEVSEWTRSVELSRVKLPNSELPTFEHFQKALMEGLIREQKKVDDAAELDEDHEIWKDKKKLNQK